MFTLNLNCAAAKTRSILCLSAVIYSSVVWVDFPCQGKTIPDEGQAKMMRDVNFGQKSNRLTPKSANKLRAELSHVARKKAKMSAENRKLSPDDKEKLRGDIAKIGAHMHEHENEKP